MHSQRLLNLTVNDQGGNGEGCRPSTALETAVWRTVQMLFLHTTGTSELNLHPYKAMYSVSPSASPAGYENMRCVFLCTVPMKSIHPLGCFPLLLLL